MKNSTTSLSILTMVPGACDLLLVDLQVVYEILQDFSVHGDWKRAFQDRVPTRKGFRKRQGADDNNNRSTKVPKLQTTEELQSDKPDESEGSSVENQI